MKARPRLMIPCTGFASEGVNTNGGVRHFQGGVLILDFGWLCGPSSSMATLYPIQRRARWRRVATVA